MKKIVIFFMYICFLFAENTGNISVLKQNGNEFKVESSILEKHDELIKMILATESMDDDERQYWFDILPSMSQKQIQRLFDILDVERKKLQELEKKYAQEISELNKKHLREWQKMTIEKKYQYIESLRVKEKNISKMSPERLLDSI